MILTRAKAKVFHKKNKVFTSKFKFTICLTVLAILFSQCGMAIVPL